VKTFGYVRVSSVGQVSGDGPERQETAIRSFCGLHGVKLDWCYCENGVSGTVDGLSRAVLAGIMEQAPCAIVIERMDRLARDLMVQEVFLKECREHKVQVFSTDQGALIDVASNDGDPTRKLIRQVLGALAEWEKSALVLKLRKARDRQRQQKGRCEGPLPYGSLPGEKETLDKIRRWRDRGLSLNRIALVLNRRKIPTRFGKQWRKNTISGFLRRG